MKKDARTRRPRITDQRINRRADESAIVRAILEPPDRMGRYCICAEGFLFESRYPENRIAKVLFESGYRGRLEVYGLSADGRRIILRYTCDIEKMAARQMTETAEGGIRFVRWSEKSLGALRAVLEPKPLPRRPISSPPAKSLARRKISCPPEKVSVARPVSGPMA